MLRLPITNRKREVVAYALVDDDLFLYLSKVRWHLGHKGYPKTGFRRADGTQANVHLHQVVFRCKYRRDPYPGLEIDHIDRNPLNAQRSNLREVTTSFNQANANKRRDNTSGYKGVSWNKRDRKWYAQIMVNQKLIFLGSYVCKHEAARAVNRAYENHFPGVAIPNPEADSIHLDQSACDATCRHP